MSIRKPEVFIVGAPKCGTTAMAKYLASHPGLFMARKEMHFFGSDLDFGHQFYRRDEPAYLEEFRGCPDGVRAGEASVWYLYSTRAAAEIKAFSPDARIVIMLREPAEMLHSLYWFFRWDGNEILPTFAEALAAEGDRAAGRRLGRRSYFPQGLLYRRAARFAEQVRRYFEVFGRDRVRVVLYDDFAADPAAVYRGTIEFLGLDPGWKPPGFEVVNSARSPRHPALQAFLRDPVIRSAALAIRPFMPRFLFSGLQHLEHRLLRFNARVQARPPLEPWIRAQLRREFAAENEALGRLLGRDLSAWGTCANAPEPGQAIPVWLREALAAR